MMGGRAYLATELAAVQALQLDVMLLSQVPRSKKVSQHPISGHARINLTFRRLDPASAARAPLCRCGNQV